MLANEDEFDEAVDLMNKYVRSVRERVSRLEGVMDKIYFFWACVNIIYANKWVVGVEGGLSKLRGATFYCIFDDCINLKIFETYI